MSKTFSPPGGDKLGLKKESKSTELSSNIYGENDLEVLPLLTLGNIQSNLAMWQGLQVLSSPLFQVEYDSLTCKIAEVPWIAKKKKNPTSIPYHLPTEIQSFPCSLFY